MRSTKTGYFLLFIASILLSLLFCPPVDRIWDDQLVYRYAGMLIAKGRVPYLDLFDHKPPLIYLLNWLLICLGSWGPWIVDALFVAGATLFFYKRCREKQLLFPALLPLFFNLLLRNYFVCEGMGLTREYTAIFLLIAFCVLIGRSRYTFFFLGLLATATLFMQQEQLLTFLPLLVYAMFVNASTARRFLTRVIQAVAGSLVIVIPILLYFGTHHALTAFWKDAFLFNFEWYADKRPIAEQCSVIHTALTISQLGTILLVASTLAVTALLLRTKQSGLIFAALLANGLAFAPEMISGRMAAIPNSFYYYLAPLSATLPILVFTVWTAADHPFLHSRISQAVFGFLLCAPVLYTAIEHTTHLRLDNYAQIRTTPEYQLLRRQAPSDYEIYVFGSSVWPLVYNDFKILAPSPWIYHHFWKWYPRWDSDHHILRSIGQDLLSHHTRYVVDCSNGPKPYFSDTAASGWWKTFLQQHYQPLKLGDSSNITLWQLKPDHGYQ
ncbi:MAG TPA: hypothetical protein VGS79_18305 [Puia sp.]|nr:hypothetical protein [Puia sp.]